MKNSPINYGTLAGLAVGACLIMEDGPHSDLQRSRLQSELGQYSTFRTVTFCLSISPRQALQSSGYRNDNQRHFEGGLRFDARAMVG